MDAISGVWYNGSYTIVAKPIKTLELHYTTIQLVIKQLLDEVFVISRIIKTKYRRHTDPNGRYDQNEIKRNKKLNYFKQDCPIFRFAIQTFLRG